MTLSTDQLRGHLEPLLLAALAAGPGHGFELRNRLEEQSSHELSLREGSIYPAIYRLEQRGLVKGVWEDNNTARRGPRRRIYRLTAKGQSELKKARSAWLNFSQTISGIMLEHQ